MKSHKLLASRKMSCSNTTMPCVVVFLLACFWLCAAALGGSVPALYVLGDSQADTGNNNFLLTVLRADMPHNGVDYFPGPKATGRFSNGKNFVDFLAGHLELATPPPYLYIRYITRNESTYLSGVNFASGGAGVSYQTNKRQCISFDSQIDHHYSRVYKSIVKQLGQTYASAHLASSIFAVAIGGNDIINYVRSSPVSRTPPDQQHFVASLLQSLKGQLQRMYSMGMRKLFVVGAAPLGCCPVLRLRSPAKGCDAVANDMSALYNVGVANLLRDMSAEHPDMSYSLFDASAALLHYIQNPEANGYSEAESACCGLGDKNAMFSCTPLSSLCENRSSHVFWDFVHPTEITAKKLTGVAFDGSAPLAVPINVRQLCAK